MPFDKFFRKNSKLLFKMKKIVKWRLVDPWKVFSITHDKKLSFNQLSTNLRNIYFLNHVLPVCIQGNFVQSILNQVLIIQRVCQNVFKHLWLRHSCLKIVTTRPLSVYTHTPAVHGKSHTVKLRALECLVQKHMLAFQILKGKFDVYFLIVNRRILLETLRYKSQQ